MNGGGSHARSAVGSAAEAPGERQLSTAGRAARFLGIPLGALILFAAFADLMLAFPQIDLMVSRLFYTPGAGFRNLGQPWERFVYHAVEALTVGVNLALIGLWSFNRATRRARLGLTGRKLLFLLCLLALIPGLLVNQVLKEHWGRARPVTISEFGGELRFTPAFVVSDQQGGSFSSGHAAAAGYLVAVAVVLFGPRSGWVVATALFAAIAGAGRIAAGGHFFSDVVTSAFLILFGYLALHRLFFGGRLCGVRPA